MKRQRLSQETHRNIFTLESGNTSPSRSAMSPSSRLSNGHTNGFSNGVSPSDVSLGGPSSESVQDTRAVSLYPSSSIDREEFIRLTLQALKDVGYQ